MKKITLLTLVFVFGLFVSLAFSEEGKGHIKKGFQSETHTDVNVNVEGDRHRKQAPSIAQGVPDHSPRTCAYTPASGGGSGLSFAFLFSLGIESEHCLRVQRINQVKKLGFSERVSNEMKQQIFFENEENFRAFRIACEWLPKEPECVNLANMKKKKEAAKTEGKKEACYGCESIP